MFDVLRNQTTPQSGSSRSRATTEPSPEMMLLSQQTSALDYIIAQLGVLSTRVRETTALPVEQQPDYELATRRLLQEAV